MRRKLAPVWPALWRGAIALLTLEIVTISVLRYFTDWQSPPGVILANAFAKPFLPLHVIGGVTALAVGPLQFVRRIRERVPAFHRATGKIYAAACAVGAPAGFMLAIGTKAGPIAALGFAIPAVLWPIFTFAGIRHAIGGRFAEHRAWMIRSYAVTANAITLRVMLPAAGLMGIPFLPAYQVIAWLGWIVNLGAAELYLMHRTRSAASFGSPLIA